ncbi:hypothetical protein RRSWK_05075 [Rhodopirellula sp. SWK7]|nr:hypothetical protein RRSWK_05075 [Rhodopirellula sp. SWK7]
MLFREIRGEYPPLANFCPPLTSFVNSRVWLPWNENARNLMAAQLCCCYA